jgi:hypothetical protein
VIKCYGSTTTIIIIYLSTSSSGIPFLGNQFRTQAKVLCNQEMTSDYSSYLCATANSNEPRTTGDCSLANTTIENNTDQMSQGACLCLTASWNVLRHKDGFSRDRIRAISQVKQLGSCKSMVTVTTEDIEY